MSCAEACEKQEALVTKPTARTTPSRASSVTPGWWYWRLRAKRTSSNTRGSGLPDRENQLPHLAAGRGDCLVGAVSAFAVAGAGGACDGILCYQFAGNL